ncbi:MAG: MFS transporter [Parachlamydiales bacterium]|jgi:hypothetical protein
MDNKVCFKTKFSLLLMNLTEEPLLAFYTFLPFILRKEMGINAFQLSLFVMLRPVLSSLTFFWSLALNKKKNPNLLKNSILAWVIARIPFVFFPIFNNFYYIFFAAGIYQLFYKAGQPAWNEIVKRKIINQKLRENIYSVFSCFSYIESIVFGLIAGHFLDKGTFNWKLVFSISALVGLSSIFIQRKIEVPKSINKENQINDKKSILSPIGDIFNLIKTRKDFLDFQIGFAIGGFALMLIAPAFNIFSNDVLNLSYKNMMNARLITMGLGFVFSTYFWNKALEKKSINYLTSFVLLGFSSYIMFVILSKYYLPFFYLAFFCYGIAQAGSTLFWKISPMIFSRNQDSLLFTTTNLFFLGIRGLIAPIFGFILCNVLNLSLVLLIGCFISLYGAYFMMKLRKSVVLSEDVSA